MIPKIIHYTWFSGDEMPQIVNECMASWERHLPDYEFRLWDMDAIKDIDAVFLREALSVKKWAYAADYVRLYALYHEGGIYLDTDVMVYKSFMSIAMRMLSQWSSTSLCTTFAVSSFPASMRRASIGLCLRGT